MYEPGLIYRVEEPRAVILLFSSGKLVCTGVRMEDVYQAVDRFLRGWRKTGAYFTQNNGGSAIRGRRWKNRRHSYRTLKRI